MAVLVPYLQLKAPRLQGTRLDYFRETPDSISFRSCFSLFYLLYLTKHNGRFSVPLIRNAENLQTDWAFPGILLYCGL